MVFEKAAYWIAVGVLALFVSNNFAARHGGEVRCLADRSLVAVEQVSGHAARFMGMAEMMLGRGEIHLAGVQTRLASAETRLASMQAVIASREAALARVESGRAQMMALEQLRGTVVCPRQNLRMTVPQPLRDGTI
jgi:hypothetical protein